MTLIQIQNKNVSNIYEFINVSQTGYRHWKKERLVGSNCQVRYKVVNDPQSNQSVTCRVIFSSREKSAH